jgi:hypothetical protein
MAALPEPWLTLSKRIRAAEEGLQQLRNRSPFFGTGMHANGANGLDSDNYVAGASGFSLRGGDGFLEINDIRLRGNIIGNDALTNPSSPLAVYDSTSNFSVPTSLTNIKTVTIPVPAGFTSASVQLMVRCIAINSTGGLDYLFSQANINGYNGYALPTAASGSGGSCLNTSQFAVVLAPGTLGSNVVLQIAVQTSFGAWAASASNVADMAASITWYR